MQMTNGEIREIAKEITKFEKFLVSLSDSVVKCFENTLRKEIRARITKCDMNKVITEAITEMLGDNIQEIVDKRVREEAIKLNALVSRGQGFACIKFNVYEYEKIKDIIPQKGEPLAVSFEGVNKWIIGDGVKQVRDL